MAEQSLFHQLEIEAFRAGITPRSKESIQWFRKKAGRLFPNRSDLLKDEALTWRNRPGSGKMYMYFYDPKLKEELPFYDTFPLVLPFGPAKGGFYGINLHYLPYLLRAQVLGELLDYKTTKTYSETTKLRMSYNLLNNLKNANEVKPCIKHYLSNHVNSRFLKVNPEDWQAAIFLPIENFVGATKEQVFRDSRSKF